MFKNNAGWRDGQTQPIIEIGSRILKKNGWAIKVVRGFVEEVGCVSLIDERRIRLNDENQMDNNIPSPAPTKKNNV